ncbi:MAG TPA: hypothetical protein ENG51_10125 [Deltaproteobacteria bacterium]|nr:hypothetical protein [Deltaproteobacteria bacterium]
MKREKSDVIKKFYVIKGPELDFLAALFLERGVTPRVVCRAKLKDGRVVYAHKTGESLSSLERITVESSQVIADQYGYDLISVPLPEGFTDIELLTALREAKNEIQQWATWGGLN